VVDDPALAFLGGFEKQRAAGSTPALLISIADPSGLRFDGHRSSPIPPFGQDRSGCGHRLAASPDRRLTRLRLGGDPSGAGASALRELQPAGSDRDE
jgi:hypothetical protein